MAKTNAERQAEYRAKRQNTGLCHEAGCKRKAGTGTRCESHRKAAAEHAAHMAGVNRNARQERFSKIVYEFHDKRWYKERVRDLEIEVEVLRMLLERRTEGKVGVVIAELGEGRPDAKTLISGFPAKVALVA